MKTILTKLEHLMEQIIQRNEVLLLNNKELKLKIRELEENVRELEKGKNKPHEILNDQLNTKGEIDLLITEVDKCINITQNMIDS